MGYPLYIIQKRARLALMNPQVLPTEVVHPNFETDKYTACCLPAAPLLVTPHLIRMPMDMSKGIHRTLQADGQVAAEGCRGEGTTYAIRRPASPADELALRPRLQVANIIVIARTGWRRGNAVS